MDEHPGRKDGEGGGIELKQERSAGNGAQDPVGGASGKASELRGFRDRGHNSRRLKNVACSMVLQTRKPYTMTKQRERWTDEEHQRFVEALRVHGRQWRKIEGAHYVKTQVISSYLYMN
jgi:SHAQKYF class myb-like DNA-binding protein